MDSIKPADNELTKTEQDSVNKLKEEVNLNDSTSIIAFGASAQKKASDFVDSILGSIKTKDLNEAGKSLTSLVGTIRGFSAESESKGNFITRFFTSNANRIHKLRASYKSAESNLDSVVNSLEKHRLVLMQDLALMDKLYEKNIEYIDDLRLYIEAGEQKLKEIHEVSIPKLREEAEESNDQLKAQELKDMIDAYNRFEKKVHDLKLTRTVSMQLLPQIRLQQANNSVLVDKIHSSIVNSIPLWKSQMVIALGLAHTHDALAAQRAVTDATNEMLRQNSEMLKTATIETAKESERAIVDIEAIKKANADIISSVEQVVAIQKEGRQKRLEAEEEIKRLEGELKTKLINALQ